MAQNTENLIPANDAGRTFFQWQIPEFSDHSRTGIWYLVASILAIALIVYCIIYGNYFFALIILLAAFLIFLKKYNQPLDLDFKITEEGLTLGNQLFSYDDLSGFYIIYNPPVKKLYFKLKSFSPDDLSIPLFDNNPLPIRTKLLEYLDEDLSKERQTFSDIFETLFKL